MADVTSMLITIYGSKELFVSEYQSLLADRLLALTDFEVTREIKHIELLKLRFGEDQVMTLTSWPRGPARLFALASYARACARA